MKRLAFIFGLLALLLMLIGLACFIFAKPLLRWGLTTVESRVSKETPYELNVGSARLHIKNGLVLNDVALKAKNADNMLLTVREFQIRPQWRALLKRQLILESVTLDGPRLSLDESFFSQSSESGAFLQEIHRFEIRDGFFTWRSSSTPELQFSPVNISGALHGEQLSIDSYSIALASQTLRGDGQVVLASSPTFDIRFEAEHVALDRMARRFSSLPPQIQLVYSGEGRVSGNADQWKIDSSGNTAGGSVSFQWVRGTHTQLVECSFNKVRLSQFVTKKSVDEKTTATGHVRARLALDWNQMLHATATISVEGFMPNKVRTDIALSGEVAIDQGHGQTRFEVRGAEMLAHVNGSFSTGADTVNAAFDLASQRIQSLQPFYRPLGDCRGGLASSGTVSGVLSHPTITASVRLANFNNAIASVAELKMNMDLLDTRAAHIKLNASASDVRLHRFPDGSWDLKNAEGSWDGTPSKADVGAHLAFKNKTEFKGAGVVSHNEDVWKFVWSQLGYSFKNAETWNAKPGGTIEYASDNDIKLVGLEIPKDGGVLNVQHLHMNSQRLDVNAYALRFPLDVSIPVSSDSYTVKGMLEGKVVFSGTMDAPQGRFNVIFASGTVNGHALRRVMVNGTLGDGLIHFEKGEVASTVIDEPARFHGNVPWHWIVSTAPEVPADLTVSFGPVDPVDWIKQIPHATADKGGSVQFNGHVRGRLKHLIVEGSLVVALSHVRFADYNLDLHDVAIDIDNKNELFRIKKGSAKIGKKGNIQLSGESRWPNIQLALTGKNIQFKIPGHIDFLGNADLALTGTSERPELNGKIHVIRGSYETPTKKKKESPAAAPSSGSEYAQALWQHLSMKVAAAWSNAVWYREGLTKIETQADLQVMKDHDSDQVYLIGTVSLIRGSYDAYGRDFIIKSGDLQFGPPDINPRLQVDAQYQTADVVIEAQVSGTAEQPKINFQSTPPMTQPEIISVLATGVSSVRGSELSGSGSGSSSAGLAAGVLSSYLTTQVRSSGLNVLSVDVLRVTPTATGNVWTVGRYLGPRFFFSYSTNSKDTANKVINGEYFLSPHWSVVGQTGSNTDDYMDLQFRVPWARKKKEAPVAAPK